MYFCIFALLALLVLFARVPRVHRARTKAVTFARFADSLVLDSRDVADAVSKLRASGRADI